MKRASLITTFILSCLFSVSVFAKSQVKKIDFKRVNSKLGRVEVTFSERPIDIPSLETRKKMVQLEIPQSMVWPKIEKKVSLVGRHDGTLTAYQFNKDTVRLRVQLPYKMGSKSKMVSVKMEGNKILLDFPLRAKKSKAFRAPSIGKKIDKTARAGAQKYDETFLNDLLKDKKLLEISKSKTKKNSKKVAKKKAAAKPKKEETIKLVKEDTVTNSMAAPEKPRQLLGRKQEAKGGINIVNYVGKFVAFLGLVLLLFFVIVKFVKKGVFKKANLGLLNGAKMVQVVNTTYIAPKKALMIVKVHNQYLLLSSTEKEVQYLTEIRDWPEMIKDGEKQVNGTNFDAELGTANEEEKEFTLKEALNTSQPEGLAKLLGADPVEDKVKLSDQIKTKIKGLKSLQ